MQREKKYYMSGNSCLEYQSAKLTLQGQILELGVLLIQPVASMVASSNEPKSHDLSWFRFIDNLYFWKFPQTNLTDAVFPKWNRNPVNSGNLINH